MPSPDFVLTFLLATAIFAYMPGPATLYTAVQTIVHGRRSGWLAVLGLHLGGYVHVGAAALGLSVLFNVVPWLFTFVKLLGACYLIWLGVRLFLSRQDLSHISTDADSLKSPAPPFWQSIIVEVLNPKTAIFYMAFLPQFADPSAALPVWGQLLLLGTCVNILFSSADVVCVVLSSAVVKYFNQNASRGRMVQCIGGGVLIALGIKLALTRH